MEIHNDSRPPQIRPNTERPGRTVRETVEPKTPQDESGEFATKFREALKQAGVRMTKPHVDKHSDYWMG
jgi:hypothetical protein